MTRTLNFSSGPATLPEPVLRRAQAALWDLDGTGIGILEHSHRGAAFRAVLERTTALVRQVGGIGDEFAVLFLTAGATHHFTLVPHNFLGPVLTSVTPRVDRRAPRGRAVRQDANLARNAGPAFDTTPTELTYSCVCLLTSQRDRGEGTVGGPAGPPTSPAGV